MAVKFRDFQRVHFNNFLQGLFRSRQLSVLVLQRKYKVLIVLLQTNMPNQCNFEKHVQSFGSHYGRY